MDFLKACGEAQDRGFTYVEFLKVWEIEMKMKQTQEELKLQALRNEVAARTLSMSEITAAVDAQLSKFRVEQLKETTKLCDDLTQQNQAHISDISRLLEGFASLVGRVVKGELETAVAKMPTQGAGDLPPTPAGLLNGAKLSNFSPASSVTWSKVHTDSDQSSARAGGKVDAAKLPEPTTQGQGKTQKPKNQNQKHPQKEQQQQAQQKEQKPKQAAAAKQVEKKKQKTAIRAVRDVSPIESLEGEATGSSNQSLDLTEKSGSKETSGTLFFPDQGQPANFSIDNFSKFAASGKPYKSPVYYMQDCPCKVQLSLWFDPQAELAASVSVWGLASQPLQALRVFKVSGTIQNKNSKGFSPLFSGQSQPIKITKSPSDKIIKMSICLKTAKVAFTKVTLAMLRERTFVWDKDNEFVSINWTIQSEAEDCLKTV